MSRPKDDDRVWAEVILLTINTIKKLEGEDIHHDIAGAIVSVLNIRDEVLKRRTGP